MRIQEQEMYEAEVGSYLLTSLSRSLHRRFGTANKPFLPPAISPGCVEYTVHPILITAHFVLITQSQ